MTRHRVIHMTRDVHGGEPETFPSTFTVCAPTGERTRADWDRYFLSTSDPALVNCSKCKKIMSEQAG